MRLVPKQAVLCISGVGALCRDLRTNLFFLRNRGGNMRVGQRPLTGKTHVFCWCKTPATE